MYDQLRAIFPLQETSLSQGKDWGHVSGWNKFYANCRGFNYVEVYTDNNSGDHYSCNQGVPSSFTFSGYRETMDDEVFQNDHFEAASDLMVGVLNGSRTAIALALAINLFLESISLQTNLFIAFAALLFQSAISLLFNWYEYHNTHNANNNKFFKLARTILFASLGLIGLTVLMIGSIIALTAFIQLLPTIVFVTGALTALYHAVLAITNVALFLTASNPFDRNDRFLNQAFKRTIQTMGTLAVTIVAALVLSKQMAALAITSPIAISLAIISIGALLYSTCREIPQIRTWHPLRYIFKDVNKRLEELSEESISDKKKRYGKCIAEEKSPLHFETATEKRFYHGGGIIEELNIIRNCHFYQPNNGTPKEHTAPTKDQKEAARLFLQAILTAKSTEDKSEIETLKTNYYFNFFKPIAKEKNTYKKAFFNCLLKSIKEDAFIKLPSEKDTLITVPISFDEVKNLTDLKEFLASKPDIRIAIFSALHRKHSNAEAIWRAVLKYHELFVTEGKILIKKATIPEEENKCLAAVTNNTTNDTKVDSTEGNLPPPGQNFNAINATGLTTSSLPIHAEHHLNNPIKPNNSY